MGVTLVTIMEQGKSIFPKTTSWSKGLCKIIYWENVIIGSKPEEETAQICGAGGQSGEAVPCSSPGGISLTQAPLAAPLAVFLILRSIQIACVTLSVSAVMCPSLGNFCLLSGAP